jgi:hypothetical protein
VKAEDDVRLDSANALSSSIAFAPRSVSSAGWKMNITRPRARAHVRQHARDAAHDRGVRVVPARVHLAGDLRRDTAALPARPSAARPCRRESRPSARLAAFEHGHDARAADAARSGMPRAARNACTRCAVSRSSNASSGARGCARRSAITSSIQRLADSVDRGQD